MQIPPGLKASISGFRGHSPKILDQRLAYTIVGGYMSTISDDRPVAVARDPRKSGQQLLEAVCHAIVDSGREVLLADIIPLPTLGLYVEKTYAVAGIHITASHNPIEYNGLKLLNSNGEFIDQETLDKVFTFEPEAIPTSFVPISHTVKSIQEEAENLHLSALKKFAQKGVPLKVAVDAVNGAGSKLIPELLERMGCDVIPIATNWQADFPRTPEPKPENLRWTQEKLQGLQYDLCVVADPDSDRLTLIDENGRLLSEEFTLPLIAQGLVLSESQGIFVVNYSTSQIIEDVVQGSNIKVLRSKVGEMNVVEKMREVSAIFGGEGNGGVIDPKVHHGRDALIGIVHIVNLLRTTGQTLSELVDSLPQYSTHKSSLSIKGLNPEDIYTKARDVFSDADEILDEDGLRFAWTQERRWIHLRPSNTELIFRIIAEAKTKIELDDMLLKIKSMP